VVYRKEQSFKLTNEGDRVRFALELYNLLSALDDESGDGGTREEVQNIKEYVNQLGNDHGMESFASRKCRATHDSDGENQHSAHQKRGNGGAVEQLEGCGYEVVPDVFETDGGTWESITKVQLRNHFSIHDVALTIVLQLPPHIHTVFRQSDPKKTKLIAKQVCERSDELYILKYLRTIRPQSPHVISFIETIPSITGGWLILPKLHFIGDQALLNSCGVSRQVHLGWGLIKELAYLHEHKVAHRDIKPDNLVCDDVFRLQIINFDVAMEVEDENTKIDEYRGTEGWTAPEMGEQDGPTPMYSPIKADRWSCGCVILRHIMVRKGDNRLSKFAYQLMAKDPQQRPSLLEWDKRPAAPLANVGGKESRPRQEMVEVDMKQPNAKKPRLAVTERGVQPELNGLQASRPRGAVF
jgi:serine/threonine protein kinase